MTCFTKAPLSTDLPADVLVKVSVWRPPVWDTYADGGQLELKVLPVVRCWVAAARPGDVPMARRMLRAVSEFAMWMYDTSGVVDVRLLLPGNVEFWCNQFNGHQSKTWRSNKRWLLRRVGRAAFGDGWPPVGELTRKHVPVRPYTLSDEAAFRISACLPARAEPAGRRWVVAATLGAGLLSPAIAAAETSDVMDLGGGRVAVRVRGRHPRVVPVRRDYTSLVTEALGLVGGERLISATHRTAVSTLCRQVGFGGHGSLSVRRARSTWLVAHLRARTSLAALRHIAGPVSGDTLTALLTASASGLDPVDAAVGGLGA